MRSKHSNVIGCGNDINDNNYNKNTKYWRKEWQKIANNQNSKWEKIRQKKKNEKRIK